MKELFWRVLILLRLRVLMQRLICRSGRYHQYQPGMCGWCGKPHVNVARYYKQQLPRNVRRGK